jgi:hypothetical protein
MPGNLGGNIRSLNRKLEVMHLNHKKKGEMYKKIKEK